MNCYYLYIANQNPFVSIIIGDFKEKSKNWHSTDYDGKQLESLTSQWGFKQVISDLSQSLESNSSCIDLVFTSQPNFVMTSVIHSSLLPYYHHQKIHGKVSLKIIFAPPYEWVVWHCQNANNDLIQRSIFQFNRERAFSDKTVNKQMSILNETNLNIMTNCIPHETNQLSFNIITTLPYAIAVNLLFWESSLKAVFSFNYTINDAGYFKSVSCRSWMLTISLFIISINFTKSV